MKKRFTDEQIIQMLKEQEVGEKTADLCRRYGISLATCYKYKSKYGGMEPYDAARLRTLKAEETLQMRRRGGRTRVLGTRKPMELPERQPKPAMEP